MQMQRPLKIILSLINPINAASLLDTPDTAQPRSPKPSSRPPTLYIENLLTIIQRPRLQAGKLFAHAPPRY